MKKTIWLMITMAVLCFTGYAMADTKINEVNFPDDNFRSYVSEKCDKNKDGKLSKNEISKIKNILCYNMNIKNLDGIEFFTDMKSLLCYGNRLTTLDVSKNTALTKLRCSGNQLTSLDVSKNITLTELECGGNQLTLLDVSKNTSLTRLSCSYNQLISIDVTKNIALAELECDGNKLTSLDVSKNTSLTKLNCYSNQLNSLDVSNNILLTSLNCSSNQLASLDVSRNIALTELFCSFNELASLDVSKNTALTKLSCCDNELKTLDVSNNKVLTELECDGNKLTLLDVSRNIEITRLGCTSNQLTSLDLNNNAVLEWINCADNQLKTLDISKNVMLHNLTCMHNIITVLDVTENIFFFDLVKNTERRTGMDLWDSWAGNNSELFIDKSTRVIAGDFVREPSVTSQPKEEPTPVTEITEIPEITSWDCPVCGRKGNTDNFCGTCGKERPKEEIRKDYQIGDIITFGRFPQTFSGKDNTPIEWEILDIEGDKALIISRYGLDAQPYDTHKTNVTWETCSLRIWLNETFMDTAFTSFEQDSILLTNVDNSARQGYSGYTTNGCKNTEDRIFLLSYAEANQYFGLAWESKYKYGNRSQAALTDYAVYKGAYFFSSSIPYPRWGYTRWWLRSPGRDQKFAAGVLETGELRDFNVGYENACVRPALWIDLLSGAL